VELSYLTSVCLTGAIAIVGVWGFEAGGPLKASPIILRAWGNSKTADPGGSSKTVNPQ